MPGRDGTGPLGVGAMTGRGLGACAGTATAERCLGLGFRRGQGRGQGFRRGMGWGNQSSLADGPTKQTLTEQVEYLESLLKGAKNNLEHFSKDGKAQ
jgi:hypothetical protein